MQSSREYLYRFSYTVIFSFSIPTCFYLGLSYIIIHSLYIPFLFLSCHSFNSLHFLYIFTLNSVVFLFEVFWPPWFFLLLFTCILSCSIFSLVSSMLDSHVLLIGLRCLVSLTHTCFHGPVGVGLCSLAKRPIGTQCVVPNTKFNSIQNSSLQSFPHQSIST